MSLESKIEVLTQVIQALTTQLQTSNVAPAVQATPALPTFVTPAPVIAPIAEPTASLPFNDSRGLIDYVMSAYKALGPQKGAQIQSVLTGLGYHNINDVKPEHYGQLFAGVEALK